MLKQLLLQAQGYLCQKPHINPGSCGNARCSNGEIAFAFPAAQSYSGISAEWCGSSRHANQQPQKLSRQTIVNLLVRLGIWSGQARVERGIAEKQRPFDFCVKFVE